MSDDVTYSSDELDERAMECIESFKKKMRSVIDEALGDIYVNVVPYLESDAWTNYRESLRLELEREYKFTNFKSDWAKRFRRAVFVENRDEIIPLLEKDLYKRIKDLEDYTQDYEMFRYSPRGDCYQDIKAKLQTAREALKYYATTAFMGWANSTEVARKALGEIDE